MVAPLRSLLLLPLLALAASVHGANPLYHFCGSTGNFIANGTYAASLSTLLTFVTAAAAMNAADYSFYNLSASQSLDAANAIVLCRGDVGAADCRSCLNDSAAEIASRCPVQKEAIIWYDNCMLRHSNRSIFETMGSFPAFYMWNLNNVTGNVDQFNQVGWPVMGLNSMSATTTTKGIDFFSEVISYHIDSLEMICTSLLSFWNPLCALLFFKLVLCTESSLLRKSISSKKLASE